MRKTTKFALLSMVTVMSILACNKSKNNTDNLIVDMDNIAFTSDDIIQKSFGGLGVEWGAYEDTDKIAEGGWDRVIEYMNHLEVARIRLMINYDWFCQNFDDKNNRNPNDDTWTYNFTNKYARNMMEILEYCQIHGIDVAFGCWNVIGDFSENPWNMMEKVTSDPRWAKITADILNFLVNQKGFSCIKWFVNSNEPNLTGERGSSKNYNNTYEIWEQGVKNVRKALDSIGLRNIGIVGGDITVTDWDGAQEYFSGIARNIPGYVADYGAHFYVSNYSVDRGEMLTEIRNVYSEIKKIDKGIGVVRDMNVWEAGLRDGKTSLDCQSNIMTTSYAVKMTDYTLQCLAGGLNGLVYWDFDDAMHFMYSQDTTTPKEWGMFSSLAEASSGKQELRPWYHSTSLLTHLFRKGNRIYSPLQNDTMRSETVRSIATVNKDGTQGGFVCVNSGRQPITKTFYLDDQVQGDKLYIYRFAEGQYRLGEDGYIIPNEIIDGSLNKKMSVSLSPASIIVVSNTRL